MLGLPGGGTSAHPDGLLDQIAHVSPQFHIQPRSLTPLILSGFLYPFHVGQTVLLTFGGTCRATFCRRFALVYLPVRESVHGLIVAAARKRRTQNSVDLSNSEGVEPMIPGVGFDLVDESPKSRQGYVVEV